MLRLSFLWVFLVALSPSIVLGSNPLEYRRGEPTGRFRAVRDGLPSGAGEGELVANLDQRPEVFAHLEYGTNRPPLILAASHAGSSSAVYVDINGDLRLDDDERIPLVEQCGRARVSPDFNANTSRQDLVVRFDGERFTVASGGHLEGQVELGDQTIFARIIDQDANGRFSDNDDRLMLDLDADGKFSPLRERFASRGVLRVHSRRYTIGYGDDERSIRLLPLLGTGYLIPKLSFANRAARVTDFRAELVSNGGVHISLDRLDSAAEVPVGTYRVKRLKFDAEDDRKWKMAFEQERSREGSSVTVNRGETIEFDLLGSLTLESEVVQGSLTSRTTLTIQPSLKTSTGLYLTASFVGDLDAQDDNRLTATLIDLGSNSQRSVRAVEGTGFGCGQFCPITFGERQRVGSSSLVVTQFNSGPLAGELIRTTAPPGVRSTPLDDTLELP